MKINDKESVAKKFEMTNNGAFYKKKLREQNGV
jgi:hypothetical protein